MGKINEFQAAWAEGVGLDVQEASRNSKGQAVTIRHEGKVLGEGATVLDAVLDAFNQRRKTAETLQTELSILAGLGKNPENTLSALDEVFPPEDEEEEEEEEEEEGEEEVRVYRR